MSLNRVVTAWVAACIVVSAGASLVRAESVVVTSGQFAPLAEKTNFALYGVGEGIEWVPGYASTWVAGIDVPPRARLVNLLVYCLDNVAPNAMVQLFKVKGDGSPPEEIEVVVTGGTRDEPGTGFMSGHSLEVEPRVDRTLYQYFIKVTLPARPDDVHGILRVNAVELAYQK